jgi:hypothetical protein
MKPRALPLNGSSEELDESEWLAFHRRVRTGLARIGFGVAEASTDYTNRKHASETAIMDEHPAAFVISGASPAYSMYAESAARLRD